ncbi:MAG: hypothetical protein AAFR54_22345 [Planctomycetota bacterium]
MDAFDPDAGSPSGHADRGDARPTARPARVKAGPLAAALATAAILGATALPSPAPIGLPEGPPARAVDVRSAAGALDLGATLGRFTFEDGARVEELEDGGARVTGTLRSERDADAGFELSIRLVRAEHDARARVLAPTGDPARPLLTPSRLAGGDLFDGARGELAGIGLLDGHVLTLRLDTGTVARLGALEGERGLTARFDALSTQQPIGAPRLADATADLDVRLR